MVLVLSLAQRSELAAALTPYSVDTATLHLWHLDEATTPCIDSAPGGTNLTVLSSGGTPATLNNASFAGFGTAVSTIDGGQNGTADINKNAALSPRTLTNGTSDNVTMTLANPTNGAFTFEALVRINFNPALNLGPGPSGNGRNTPLQIFSGDGDVPAERIFQWRLDPVGFGSGDTSVPRIEFINLRQEVDTQSVIISIPTNGPHAIVSNGWFHVAVSYNGNENTTDNLRFYWTALSTTNGGANLIGTSVLTNDLSVGACDFVVGNEGRGTNATDNFIGLIDEVRISSVDRSPTNFLFDPNDVDADGLPDAWEYTYFGSLSHSASEDFDGDGFSNLQEFQEGSDPTSFSSIPKAVLPRFYAIEDGNTNTSEYGYAGSSAINAVSFVCSGLLTVSNKQILAYYGRHQTDASYPFNNTIWIARRNIGTNIWQIYRTTFTANNITDGHDVVCFGIDGDGIMHMSWGMHGDAFHYTKSLTNVISDEPISFGPDTSMTGDENTATYPQFLTMPGGDLIYIYRKGTSGAGDTYINRYTLGTQTWTNIHVSGVTVIPFIKGTTWIPDYNAYGQMPCVDSDGNLYLIWTWRYQSDSPAGESGYQTNHDFDYGKSTNGGLTWLRFSGIPYALPISQSGENGDTNTIADKIISIPEGFSLINQAGMCLDSQNNPVIATWWAPGTPADYRRQYMIAYPGTNGVWQVRQVSQRTIDATNSKKSETFVRDLGRPVVVCDDQDRIIVLYRDNQGSNGLTIAHSLPKAVDPDRLVWTTFDLTTDNLGNYEPVIDLARWQHDRVLVGSSRVDLQACKLEYSIVSPK